MQECSGGGAEEWIQSLLPPTLLPQKSVEKWRHLFHVFSKHLSEVRAIGTRKDGGVAAVTTLKFVEMQCNSEQEICQNCC